MNDAGPELSVVLVTDSYETIQTMLGYLRAQSARDRLELVLVAPRGAHLDPHDPAVDGFREVQLVEVDDLDDLPRARAQGVRAARGPLVMSAETHAFPDPTYAETLIEAHKDRWAVVGPAMANANPQTMRSWAKLLVDYGPWVERRQRGVMSDVPGHNSVYKRSVLLEFGSELEEKLKADSLFHEELRSKGHELYLEPAARVAHLNLSRPLPWLVESFDSGRAFAALRSRGWSRPRRAVYAAGSPLIPVVRLSRIVRSVRASAAAPGLLPRVLPALLGSLVTSAVGEFVGYASGASGSSPRRLYWYELHKARYVRPQEAPRAAS